MTMIEYIAWCVQSACLEQKRQLDEAIGTAEERLAFMSQFSDEEYLALIAAKEASRHDDE